MSKTVKFTNIFFIMFYREVAEREQAESAKLMSEFRVDEELEVSLLQSPW